MSVMSEAFSQYQLLQNGKEQFEAYSITPLFSASVVCSFYAEVLPVLAIMSDEMGAQEKKPVFSGNLILGNHYIFRR